jgi:FMN-dependent NADH-azoreductase
MPIQMNPSTLLHIDASPRSVRSKSRQLGRDFVAEWLAKHPTAQIIRRDLATEPPPFVSEAWVEGAFTPATQHSAGAKAAMAISDRYVDELLAANTVLITTPMYNLSLPAALKAWIDQIVRVGRTFAPSANGFEGLAKGKTAIVVVASGSDFRPNTPAAAYNFLEPYLRGVLAFIGITNVEFVYAHSMNQPDAAGAAAVASAKTALAELAAA